MGFFCNWEKKLIKLKQITIIKIAVKEEMSQHSNLRLWNADGREAHPRQLASSILLWAESSCGWRGSGLPFPTRLEPEVSTKREGHAHHPNCCLCWQRSMKCALAGR